MTLEGKVALVTGGSQGIGAAIAKKLASEGADIAILYVGNHRSNFDPILAWWCARCATCPTTRRLKPPSRT